ncbi:hypothetical protein OO009_04540 [Flavobacteriaceae bacterium KMM 6897]|nr:hypothetical protein [Flavobacteriaceae bacterium KMM 6897]MEB8345899.1 hypothetical protein [Flavobacteriaceae bacterium KMM 6898]
MEIIQKTAIIIIFILLAGCTKQKVNATKILANEEGRAEIMEAIIDDDKMISQFMDKMINNEHTKAMLAEKRDMIHMKQIFREINNDTLKAGMMMEHMMGMMQKDSAICRMMYRNIGNNLHMKGLMGRDSTMMCPIHN